MESVKPTTVFDEVGDDGLCYDVDAERLVVTDLSDPGIVDDTDEEGFGAAFGCFEEVVVKLDCVVSFFILKHIPGLVLSLVSGSYTFGQVGRRKTTLIFVGVGGQCRNEAPQAMNAVVGVICDWA